jgi:hypothetical protein
MKRFIVLMSICFCLSPAFGQQNETQNVKQSHQFLLGAASGLESMTGMFGIVADYQVWSQLYLHGGIGIGGWGYKYGVGARYDLKTTNSLGVGLNIARGSGISSFDLETTINGSTSKSKVELKPSSVLLPVLYYKILFGNGHRVYFEGGYALPLTVKPYKTLDGSTLTNDQRMVLDVLQPGGLSLGLGIQFAL